MLLMWHDRDFAFGLRLIRGLDDMITSVYLSGINRGVIAILPIRLAANPKCHVQLVSIVFSAKRSC
jgi:hypothetical protein